MKYYKCEGCKEISENALCLFAADIERRPVCPAYLIYVRFEEISDVEFHWLADDDKPLCPLPI